MMSAIALMGLLAVQAATLPATDDLLVAARTADVARVRTALAQGAAVDVADRRGRTPLIWAAAAGSIDVVRLLLDAGAAVNHRAADGTTALLVASGNGFVDVVRALILAGADLAARQGGVTAGQFAVERGHAEAAAVLDQAEALGRRLLQAAGEGHDTVVRQMLALGSPINMVDDRGATALMIAARNGDLGILQALLSRRADPFLRDPQGRTALDWAQQSPTTARFVVAFLEERTAALPAPRSSAPPQSPQVKASLSGLATLLARVPASTAPLRAAQRRATTALARLQELSARWPANSPDDYRDNLAAAIEALDVALRRGNADTLAATVGAVAEDLEVKLEHCTLSGGALGGSVLVRVRTRLGDAEVRSWQVFYMPRIFEAAGNAAPDLFPQLSSPTQETLVPGRYVMWVRDPASNRLGERTVVKVGEGRKELLVDLPVPAATR